MNFTDIFSGLAGLATSASDLMINYAQSVAAVNTSQAQIDLQQAQLQQQLNAARAPRYSLNVGGVSVSGSSTLMLIGLALLAFMVFKK